MTTPVKGAISRRSFLADAGVLVVAFTLMPRSARAESLGVKSRSTFVPVTGVAHAGKGGASGRASTVASSD
jgi:hypothetical protein